MFLAGLGAGAIAGLLFAPKSGSELRAAASSRIAEGGQALRDAVNEGGQALRDAVNESMDTMRHSVDRRLAVVDHTVKEGVAAFNEAREVFLDA